MERFIYFRRLCLTLICCLSVCLNSWADDYTKDGIIYNLNEANNTATVKAISDKSLTSVTVRPRVAGCDVIKIGSNAFENCIALKKITIPTSVTIIDASAFAGCSALTDVSDLSKVTSIGASAFEGCSALTKFSDLSKVTSIGASAFKNCTSLRTINLPTVSENLGGSAFEGCSSLINVEIPSLTSLNSCTFKNCTSLTTFDASNISYIYEEVFAGCRSLQNITFSDYISHISCSAFNGCNAIEAFNIKGGNYTSEGSVIFNSDKTKLICAVGNLGNYSIPSTVTSIGENAFKDCDALYSVVIPYGITLINSNTFEGCTALTSVTIPSTVTTISNAAFKGCTALPYVVIPNSVTGIYDNAFDGNSSLKAVLLKSKEVSIDEKVFPETTKVICMPINNDNTVSEDFKLSTRYISGLWYFPEEVTDIRVIHSGNGYDITSSFKYNRINSDITDILSTNDAAKTFIVNRKNVYDKLSESLRTPLENALSETNNIEDFFNSDDAELSALKAKLHAAYNQVRYAIYDQLDVNDELYDLYLQGKEISNKINSSIITDDTQEIIDQIANMPYGYHDGLITDVSQLSTNALEPREGSLEGLIDADRSTFFHSTWTQTTTDEYHYLQVDLKDTYRQLALKYSKRQYGSYYDPKTLHIYATNQSEEESWFDIGTYTCTYKYDGNETGVLILNLGRKYRYIRLVVEESYNGQKYFHWGELHAYPIELNYIHINTVPTYFDNKLSTALAQAKSELDEEWATEETIDKLREVITTFNDAPLMDFSKSEYLTLYSDKSVAVPDGLSAAVVLSNGDNIRSDYRYGAGTVIPANTGVLLKAEMGRSFYMIESETEETAPEDNLLHGTLSDELTQVEGAGKYYKLSYDSDTKSIIGFYWGAADGAPFINKAGKAFLALPATLSAQQMNGFSLNDLNNAEGNVTGVNTATTSAASFRAYDLNGRKVDAQSYDDLQPGLYIVNGKKIIK